MKDSRSRSDMSTRAIDRNYFKNFCQSIQKRRQEGKREKKKQEVDVDMSAEPSPISKHAARINSHMSCDSENKNF